MISPLQPQRNFLTRAIRLAGKKTGPLNLQLAAPFAALAVNGGASDGLTDRGGLGGGRFAQHLLRRLVRLVLDGRERGQSIARGPLLRRCVLRALRALLHARQAAVERAARRFGRTAPLREHVGVHAMDDPRRQGRIPRECLRVAGPMIAARHWRQRLRRDAVWEGGGAIPTPTVQATFPAENVSRPMATAPKA